MGLSGSSVARSVRATVWGVGLGALLGVAVVGQTVYPVSRFGAIPGDGIDDAPAIRACVAVANADPNPEGAIVELAPGVYDLIAPEAGVTAMLHFVDLTAVDIAGNGATLLIHDRDVTAIRLRVSLGGLSSGVRIRDLTIDYAQWVFTQGTIVATGSDWLEFVPDPGFQDPLIGDPWLEANKWNTQIYDPVHGRIKPNNRRASILSVTPGVAAPCVGTTTGTRVQIHISGINDFACGDKVVFSTRAGAHGVDAAGILGLTLEGVEVRQCTGFGFTGVLCPGIRIEECAVTPKGTAIASALGDGVHLSSCGISLPGDPYVVPPPVLRDNVIVGTGDDALRIASLQWIVQCSVSKPGAPMEIRATRGTTQPEAIFSGDEFEFFDSVNHQSMGVAYVQTPPTAPACGTVGESFRILPAIPGLTAGDTFISRRNAAEGYVIEGNTVFNCWGHGVKARGRGGAVRDNDIDTVALCGVFASPDFRSTKFSGWGRSLDITNNRIRRTNQGSLWRSVNVTRQGGISVAIVHDKPMMWPSGQGHIGVSIQDNVVEQCPGPALFVGSAVNTLVASNTFRNAVVNTDMASGSNRGLAVALDHPVCFQNCTDLTLAGNLIEARSPTESLWHAVTTTGLIQPIANTRIHSTGFEPDEHAGPGYNPATQPASAPWPAVTGVAALPGGSLTVDGSIVYDFSGWALHGSSASPSFVRGNQGTVSQSTSDTLTITVANPQKVSFLYATDVSDGSSTLSVCTRPAMSGAAWTPRGFITNSTTTGPGNLATATFALPGATGPTEIRIERTDVGAVTTTWYVDDVTVEL